MITNSVVPYCFDVAGIIELPSKFLYRFRYVAKWIDSQCDVVTLKNKRALICLRDFETGNFIPVRFCTIQNVVSAENIRFIDFELNGFISQDTGLVFSQQFRSILSRRGITNNAGQSLTPLVLDIDQTELPSLKEAEQASDLQRWSEITKQIGSIECFKDFSFIKVIHLINSRGVSAGILKDETGKYSFSLRPNTLYYLEVMQHMPWEIEKTEFIQSPFNIELKSEAGEITILRNSQRVVGKYDVLRFTLKTPSGYASKYTFLELEDQQTGDASKYGLRTTFLPILIQPTNLTIIVRWFKVLLSVFAVAVFFSSSLVAKSLNISSDWVRALALLLLIITSKNWDEFTKELIKKAPDAKLVS